MKQILSLSLLLSALPVAMQAEDNHLYIQPSAGEKLLWGVPSLQKISFLDGNVVLTKKDGTAAYVPIPTVKRMYISTPSAEGIEAVESGRPYRWDGDVLRLDARPDALVRIYSVTGALVMQTRLSGASADCSALGGGLYVVNVEGRIFKVVKK